MLILFISVVGSFCLDRHVKATHFKDFYIFFQKDRSCLRFFSSLNGLPIQ